MIEKVNPSHPDKIADRIAGAIGDEYVNGVPYSTIVGTAKNFINKLGGFEKLAE